MLVLTIVFMLLIISGILLIPSDGKTIIVNLLYKYSDIINTYRNNITEINHRCIFIVLYTFASICGYIYLIRILYFWFRTTEYFDVPLFGEKIKFIPKIKNKYYREEYIHTRDKVHELSQRNKRLSKEANQQKVYIKKLETQNLKIEAENNEISNNLQKLVDKVVEMDLFVQLHSNVTGELSNLMSYVLMLKNISEPMEFSREFQNAMDEFANALIKVTVDRGCDKCSSIMMVSSDEEYLKIIGSNGLRPTSKFKTFRKAQGYAGSILERGQAEVCNNVDEDPRFQQDGCHPDGSFRSIIGVPIKDFKGSVVGALFVHSKRLNVFDEIKDKVTMSYFSALLAIIFNDYYALFKGEFIADGRDNRNESMA